MTFSACIANYPESVVDRLPPTLASGIYYGWARVNQSHVYKMVMSIGWNPQWQNEKRSMVCVCVCATACVRVHKCMHVTCIYVCRRNLVKFVCL